MQTNADDMDDLFRRAAEEYPLNTLGKNWQKLQVTLMSENRPTQKVHSNRRLLWLLLLVPIALICNRIEEHFGNSSVIMPTKQFPSSLDIGPRQKGKTSVAKTENSQAISTIDHDLSKSAIEKKVPNNLDGNASVNQLGKGTESGLRRDALIHTNRNPGFAGEKKLADVLELPTSWTKNVIALPQKVGESKKMDAQQTIFFNADEKSAVAIKETDRRRETGTTPTKKRHFYLGVVAGPDISTVKFQKFSEVGFQAGILLGYQLSDRLAVEAGALSSQKYYYSTGEDFNTSKLYLPANAKVLSVDGNCRMVELPLSVLYSFRKKGKHSWFGAAGLSSYLMKEENYSYEYLYTNTGYVVPHQKTYVNQTQNWFSVLQFSVGYTSKLGAVGYLRFEPYYALPLRGIGYGELPLSSFGLRIGLTSKKF